MANLKTFEDYELIEKSRKYYYANNFAHNFFYKQINDIFPFLFKNKVREFYKKSEAYFADQDSKFLILKNRIIMAIATEDFTTNSLGHYHFNIDGIHYVYGITSIYDLFDQANKVKNSILKKKLEQPSNILQFKK